MHLLKKNSSEINDDCLCFNPIWDEDVVDPVDLILPGPDNLDGIDNQFADCGGGNPDSWCYDTDGDGNSCDNCSTNFLLCFLYTPAGETQFTLIPFFAQYVARYLVIEMIPDFATE